MVVAHRGCWRDTSENSIDAIKSCIAAGVDMVELDVRATRDGVLVLLHDATVDRTTEGTGAVADLDWKQVRRLHLREGGGRGSALTRRRIPTLREVLHVAKDKILINIDAKILLSPAVLAMVDAAGMRKQVLFKAEAPAAEIVERAPWVRSVRFQPILRQPNMADPTAAIAAYDALTPVSFEIDVKDPAFAPIPVPMLRARCARYWVNSLAGRAFDDRLAVTDPALVWGKLIAIGVDAIQTDEPIALRAYLNRTRATTHRCEPAALR